MTLEWLKSSNFNQVSIILPNLPAHGIVDQMIWVRYQVFTYCFSSIANTPKRIDLQNSQEANLLRGTH